MGAPWNKVFELLARSVLNNFTDDALAVSAGSVFQNEEFQKPMSDLRYKY